MESGCIPFCIPVIVARCPENKAKLFHVSVDILAVFLPQPDDRIPGEWFRRCAQSLSAADDRSFLLAFLQASFTRIIPDPDLQLCSAGLPNSTGLDLPSVWRQ